MRFVSVFVGMALTLIFYVVMSVHAIRFANESQSQPNDIQLSGMVVFVLVLFPMLLFVCSLSTGILVKPYIEKSFSEFLFSSPGLYYYIIMSIIVIRFALLDPPALTRSWVGFGFVWVAAGLVWSLASCAGVTLGYKLRAKISDGCKCPSDVRDDLN